MKQKNSTIYFFGMLGMLTIAYFLLFYGYFQEGINSINATMLAFSYRYGFISRGFVGTVFDLMNLILPMNMYSYQGAMFFTQISWGIYIIELFVFYGICYKRTTDVKRKYVMYGILLFHMFAVPFFISFFNFGRGDMWMLMVSILCAIILIKGKMEWLVVLLCGLGTMIHQGYVFMFVNIVLVLLIYKGITTKNYKKYGILFGASFITVSVLFLYFELFSHGNGQEIVGNIIQNAKHLCGENMEYHKDVVDKEILGIPLASREVEFRKMNVLQTPIFLIMTLPYLVLMIRFFQSLFRSVKGNREENVKYFFVAAGVLTMVPELILKCDFGRWLFAIICYYAVVMMTLLALGDDKIEQALKEVLAPISRPIKIILLIYPFVFQPLGDVAICGLVSKMADYVNCWVQWY